MAEPAWSLVLRGLVEIGGFDRGLFYDVPRDQAPTARSSTRVFVKGSPSWQRFLTSRRQLDHGALTILLSLRRLEGDERRLAVDWGCRFVNAFVLVEPLDTSCDLTDPDNEHRRALHAMAKSLLSTHHRQSDVGDTWMRDTRLADALRRLYGVWISWPEPFSNARTDAVPLRLDGPADTMHRRLFEAMDQWYPQAHYDEVVETLYEQERELFGGTIAGIRTPFLTRLGLPVLFDPNRVDRAVRRLVNQGRASAFDDGPDPAFYRGPQRPLPERMTDAEIERLVMR